MTLRGRAANGRVSGAYRGAIDFRAGVFSGVDAVNSLPLDSYLRGVVPDESPPSWPLEALKAQAVAARTYAVATMKPAATFDLYPDTRSQVYGGVAAEVASTNQAVAETRGEVVTYDGQPVVTYFFSTSGGRTEDVENTPLGNEPRPWLKSVDDPYDDTSPRHRWGPIRMSLKQAGRKLGSARQGLLPRHRGRAPRPLAADRRGRRHRHARAHPRDRRAAARALRPVRLVGVLHLDHHRRGAAGRGARGARAPTGGTRPVRVGVAARRHPRRRRRRRARAAGAARGARDAAAPRRRALGHGRLDAAAPRRPLLSGGRAGRACTACATTTRPAPPSASADVASAPSSSTATGCSSTPSRSPTACWPGS